MFILSSSCVVFVGTWTMNNENDCDNTMSANVSDEDVSTRQQYATLIG